MKTKSAASLLAPLLLGTAAMLAIAAPAAAQSSSPGEFRLPPNPTPTSSPDIQGPVDPDAPIVTRPRAPTPTPTPAPRPTVTATPTPTAAATRDPATRFTPTVRERREAREENDFTPAPSQPVEPSADQVAEDAAAAPLPQLPVASPTAAATPPVEEADGGFPWLWTLLGLLALGAGAGGFAFLRRRKEEHAPPPVIEPPLARRASPAPPPAGEAAAAGAAPLAPVAPLMVEAQALKLSRSLMFATLSYELRLVNRGPAALENIRLGGDLVTAHGRVPVDQQLADPAQPLEIVQQVAALAPGESTVLAGELRLPVQQIRPIPQGSAILYVPLLRLRIEAEGLAPFARTFVVGKRPAAPGGKLQPFRLDETPQTYRSIAQRALD